MNIIPSTQMLNPVPERSSIVLLSGGIDSTTALASLRAAGDRCSALFVGFGQPAEAEEETAARSVSNFYEVVLEVATLRDRAFGTGEIVGRNAFLVHAALILCRLMPATIVIGIHGGTQYRDCSPLFIDIMNRSLSFHTDGMVSVFSPFLDWSKGQVASYAQTLSVPLQLTYSCERGGCPCGECLSCYDRGVVLASS